MKCSFSMSAGHRDFFKSDQNTSQEVKFMSEATIAKKAEAVKNVNEMLTNAETAIVVDYRGLTVAEVTDLRKQLRDAGIKMMVIKNKILERAVEGTDYEDLKSTFVGPTAVAFSDEDAIAPANILKKFAEGSNPRQDQRIRYAAKSRRPAVHAGKCSARSNAEDCPCSQGCCRQEERRRSCLSFSAYPLNLKICA